MEASERLWVHPNPFACMLALPGADLPVREGVALHVADRRWSEPGVRRPVTVSGLESFWRGER